MLRVVLCWFDIQNGRWAGQRVGGDQQEQQHVARLRRIDKTRQLLGRDRAAFRLARPLCFGRDGPEDVRDFGQLLPLLGPVQRSPPDRQDAVDAAGAGSPVGQPFTESALLVWRDLGNRPPRPEFLPVGQAEPLGRRARQVLGMIVPVVQQDGFYEDAIGGGVPGALILDDPRRELEGCLLKVCCAKADTACLSRSGLVPSATPRVVSAVAAGLLTEPVLSDLTKSVFGVLAHGGTVCISRYSRSCCTV
ncbi:hypothetical protein [Azospirillum brasilense]|uniref:hypothetical protein n=1 Tax=Azospirillum brasilense TaxID=192 RepID=UPI001FFF8278|nr:hypothetical protein [Azospirillum brasilense]